MASLPNHLHQHPLRRPPVEFAVKICSHGPKSSFPGDRDDDLAAHDLPLVVGIGVVFAGAVVMIALGDGSNGASSSSHFL